MSFISLLGPFIDHLSLEPDNSIPIREGNSDRSLSLQTTNKTEQNKTRLGSFLLESLSSPYSERSHGKVRVMMEDSVRKS